MRKMMNGLRNEDCMKLLESSIYKNDLKKVVKNIDLDKHIVEIESIEGLLYEN